MNELNEIFIPEKLVDYSPGAVVSKTIVKGSSGTITVFAFDKGEGLSEHTAPHDALVQILDGEALITVDRKESLLERGEAILLPANVPHSLSAVGAFKMMLTMIRQ